MAQHTDEEIRAAAEHFEAWAESVDPATLKWQDMTDLRTVAEEAEAVKLHQAKLLTAVTIARARGRSWGQVAFALGVTRQAARQRFVGKLPAELIES